jgi:hypothetical protein
MNNERTIYITEEHLGDGTRQQAEAMVKLMSAHGWDIEYGNQLQHDEYDADTFEHDWDRCLDMVSYKTDAEYIMDCIDDIRVIMKYPPPAKSHDDDAWASLWYRSTAQYE